jgi:nucleoside transporter
MKEKLNISLYVRLGAMMFFQYMMFAVWWIPLAAYLSQMGFSRNLTALVLSSIAFGSVVSPLVGMLADRYFNAKYLLSFSNFMVGILLIIAAQTTNPVMLFLTLLVTMLFYMPTWPVTSAIVMAKVPSEQFAGIRVFGTIGWIMAGLFSMISLGVFKVDFDGTNLPFYGGAAVSILSAFINLTLPDIPPLGKGSKISFIDIMGFRSFVLLRDRNFAIFIATFFLSMIPFSMYWSYFSEYLAAGGFKLITVTMSIGQVLEIIILLTVPWFISRFGLRNAMILGMLFLVVRYLSLYFAGEEAQLPFIMLGVAVHGLIFGYHHLGGQIYADKKAPAELKVQVQGMIFFVTFALGLLVGNFVCGWIISMNSYQQGGETVYHWSQIWGITAIMSAAVLMLFVTFFKDYSISTSNQIEPV